MTTGFAITVCTGLRRWAGVTQGGRIALAGWKRRDYGDRPANLTAEWTVAKGAKDFHGGQQAVRFGAWKAVRQRMNAGNRTIELYDLAHDPNETRDVAAEHPELVQHAEELLTRLRVDSALFPLGR